MRTVELGESGVAVMRGGGRVMYAMYFMCPQWHEPVYGRRVPGGVASWDVVDAIVSYEYECLYSAMSIVIQTYLVFSWQRLFVNT
jgi:hypothetical protein